MRLLLLLLFHVWSFSFFGQSFIGKQWTIEFGTSTNTLFNRPACLNLRYVSPRFKWSNLELSEEQEKQTEKYKNTRLMVELIYQPPFKVLCTSFNVQSRFVRYKKLSVELYGGMKFFFVPGPDFVTIPYLKAGKELWYVNIGLLLQLNLGMFSPFADIGGDGIMTVGTEFNYHKIYRKPKSRYNLKKPALGK